MAVTQARTSRGREVRVPVSFYLELDPYLDMCERARAAGVTLSEWLRESTRRQLAQAEAGNGKR